MTTAPRSSYPLAATVLASVVAFLTLQGLAPAQTMKPIVPYVQERLGLNERQARGAIGVLLVFARDHLPKPQFDQLARRMPNAEMLMDQTHLSGIVTSPLDDTDDYEAALKNLGIAQQVAARFGPTVLEYLGAAGYYEERDVLSRVLD